MAVESPTVGTRVSYEDVANPKRVGTVAGEGVGEWRVVWDDGDVTFSDLRQSGWKKVALSLLEVMRFDRELSVGDEVVVRWSGRQGTGKVAKLNAKSLRVALDAHVDPDYFGGWSAGTQISVPRCLFDTMDRWSWNNCALPKEVLS